MYQSVKINRLRSISEKNNDEKGMAASAASSPLIYCIMAWRRVCALKAQRMAKQQSIGSRRHERRHQRRHQASSKKAIAGKQP